MDGVKRADLIAAAKLRREWEAKEGEKELAKRQRREYSYTKSSEGFLFY